MADTLDIPALLASLKQTQVIEFFTQMRTDLTSAQQAIVQQASVINQQSAVIQQHQAVITDLPNLLATAIGSNNTGFVSQSIQSAVQTLLGGSLPTSLDSLAELVAQLQLDETGAAAMLTSINQIKTTLANATNGLAATYTLASSNGTAVTNLKKEVATRARTIRFLNVTSTATLADLKVDANGVLIDYLGFPLGKIIKAEAEVLTAPPLATAITIKAGTITIMSTASFLPGVSLAGAALNLLGVAGATTSNVPSGSQLTAVSDKGGSFNLTLTILPIQ